MNVSFPDHLTLKSRLLRFKERDDRQCFFEPFAVQGEC